MEITAAISFFLFLLGIIYFYLADKKHVLNNKPKYVSVGLILGFAFILRLIVAPLIEGFSSDVDTFRFWSQHAAKDLTGIYQKGFFLDYPPFYLYFLFIIGKIASIFGLRGGEPFYILLLKLPSITTDIATGYLIYRMAKNRLSGSWALFVTAIYVFNPAIIMNSTIWGQVDSFMVFFVALGFYLMLTDKPHYSALPFAAAVLTKPQGLIFLPVVLFELIKRRDIKLFLKTVSLGIATIILIILPFVFKMGPTWIFDLYLNTVEGYKYASLNAFNFFALIGANTKPDSNLLFIFSYKVWGFIFILASVIFTSVLYYKGKGKQLPFMGALTLFLSVFMLSTRMHERYMFPVLFFLLAIFIITRDRWSLIFFGISSFTIFVNTYNVLYRMINTNYPHVPPHDPVLLFISLVNFVLLFAVMTRSWQNAVSGLTTSINTDAPSQIKSLMLWLKRKSNSRTAEKQEEYVSLKINRKDILIITIMTVVYLAIALINLGGFDVPQTDWVGKSTKDGFIVKLTEESYVSRLTYYQGLGKGSYSARYLDSDGLYKPLPDIEINNFYKWGYITVDQTTQYIKIETQQPGGMIKEIAVFGEDSRIPLAYSLLDLTNIPVSGNLMSLCDEQNIAQYNHTYMTGTYFDEIYHARTAYEHLHRISPYEWTHPPLGKLFIATGIAVFGMNTFGWRIVGTLFGAAMIPLMYLFGKKLFKKSFYGFCAAFLMMFDLMHFAQTRIATIDSYATFFVILMYYFMADYYLLKSYRNSFFKSLKPLFFSGLFLGLGIAVKWSVFYGVAGLALIFLLAKYNEYKELSKNISQDDRARVIVKEIGIYVSCVFIFIVMPATIYFLSFIPYLLVPNMHIIDIFKYQRYMFNYHRGLTATHSFSSSWWSWPLILKPIWYYGGVNSPRGMRSTIASFGNPLIWWPGIATVFAAVISAIRKNKACILLSLAIFAQYLPWAAISRITFIYHFFPVIPFVMLTIVYCIKVLMENGLPEHCVYAYLAVIAFVAIMFYPAVSGLTVPDFYIKFLRWLPTWYF